ncbi:TetR/AcrR family transcriptional regulator [Nocardia paucivorans]|uniref:TetR/AcrR family transcriptional regulator n=1 Tax=Nocardia paucivorans TaxID=114259 RepID=UPI000593580F|nr:TetR/AcrR family transcriptional regulator [Nocardia paucivorans]
MDYIGRGDPQRTLELLWGTRQPPRRGPKPKLSVDDIAAAALRIADDEGLSAVTLRRVAEAVGVTAMSLYGYVPGKAELLDLVADRAYRDYPMSDDIGADWRTRIEAIARANWTIYLAHPWLLQIAAGRPLPGPHFTAKYDYELRAVDGLGLGDIDMDLVVSFVNDYVRGAARAAVDTLRAETETGLSDRQWWERFGPALGRVLDPGRYPTAIRVGGTAGSEYGAAYDPERAFDFGVQRLLDGLQPFIEAHRSAVDGTASR